MFLTNNSPDIHILALHIMYRKSYLFLARLARTWANSNENYRQNFQALANILGKFQETLNFQKIHNPDCCTNRPHGSRIMQLCTYNVFGATLSLTQSINQSPASGNVSWEKHITDEHLRFAVNLFSRRLIAWAPTQPAHTNSLGQICSMCSEQTWCCLRPQYVHSTNLKHVSNTRFDLLNTAQIPLQITGYGLTTGPSPCRFQISFQIVNHLDIIIIISFVQRPRRWHWSVSSVCKANAKVIKCDFSLLFPGLSIKWSLPTTAHKSNVTALQGAVKK